jgi:hypothetical protein
MAQPKILLAIALAWLCCGGVRADEPSQNSPTAKITPAAQHAANGPSAAVQAELPGLFHDLGADEPRLRAHAGERLNQLAEGPSKLWLAEQVQHQLRQADVSFQARIQLKALAKLLPEPAPLVPLQLESAEIDHLIGQLDSDTFSGRLSAARRLQSGLENPDLLGTIWTRLKARWAKSAGDTTIYHDLCDDARKAWVQGNPQQIKLPPVSDAQLDEWFDHLDNAPTKRPLRSDQMDLAWRELIDLSLRDEELPRLRAVLKRRGENNDLAATEAAKIDQLAQWIRPAMVAEIWAGGHVGTTQHLLIGVPQMPPTAVRPTFFDKANEDIIHCASGNSLAPGDYHTGWANPPTHPQSTSGRDGVMFHLLYLPTPRRQVAYEFAARGPESERLSAITKRTCAGWLAEKHDLSEREIAMLLQLDGHVLSRFAGPYFKQIDDHAWQDEPAVPNDPFVGRAGVDFPSSPALQSVVRTSRHGMICMVLAMSGDHEAIPGLVEAIKNKRFLAGAKESAYALPWIAALGIANRDPWDGIDGWLADLIDRTDPLNFGRPEMADVGACAAYLLLTRHGEAPDVFGLEQVEPADPQPTTFGSNVFRFAQCPVAVFKTPADRARVLEWWKSLDRSVARR